MKPHDTYRLFFKPGEVTEVRSWGLKGRNAAWEGSAWGDGTIFGYFDNAKDFGAAAAALDKANATGVYFMPNPVKVDLLARAANRLKAYTKKDRNTTDVEIECIRWLLIDLDPNSYPGISATRAEVDRANKIRRKIDVWLQDKFKFPPGVPAISGNGAHLMYRLPDLENTEATKALVKSAIQTVGHVFASADPPLDVDQKVFNPARIWKLYGTTARKGDSTPQRPWRKSKIFAEYLAPAEGPPVQGLDDIPAASIESLTALAAEAPAGVPAAAPAGAAGPSPPAGSRPRSSQRTGSGDLGTMDIGRYLGHYGQGYTVKPDGGKTFYRLEPGCLFDSSHPHPQAAIVQDTSGKITYHCYHASCRHHTWAEAKQIISGEDDTRPFWSNYDPDYKPKPKSSPTSPSRAKTPDASDDYKPGWEKVGNQIPDTEKEWVLGGRTKKGVATVNPSLLARELIGEYKEIFQDDLTREFWIYNFDRGVYELTSNGIIERRIRMKLENDAKGYIVNEVLTLLGQEVRLSAEESPVDKLLINVKNGMYDIRTGRVEKHDPGLYSRIQLPVKYDPEATCPTWENSLLLMFKDDIDKAEVLRQFTGYSFYPGLDFGPAAVFAIGGGGNGKGVVEHVLVKLHGPANISHVSLKGMEDRWGPYFLMHKLLNTSSETESGLLECTNFKSIVAGDEIEAEVKYNAKRFTFTPYAKHYISMNHRPNFQEKTPAIFRRLVPIEFAQDFERDPELQKHKDPRLKHRIVEEELDGVFRWALEGLEMVMENKTITLCESSIRAKQQMHQHINNVVSFVAEECYLDQSATHHPRELYDKYVAWMDSCNMKGVYGLQKFYEQLELNFNVTRNRKVDNIVHLGGLGHNGNGAGAAVAGGSPPPPAGDLPPIETYEPK